MHSTPTDIPTHYATLGLDPSAPAAVIRASFKALALLHHPDKVFHLNPEERAFHAARFRNVQEAYDVIGSVSLKAAYDAELARHDNRVDSRHSTFHVTSASRTLTSLTLKRSSSIRLTTPEEKRAMKAKAREDMTYLREQRMMRDAEDATMSDAGLKFMRKTWSDLAAEHANDAFLRAHYVIRMQVYQDRIAKREEEQIDWLANLSKPKTFPLTPQPIPTRSFTPSLPKEPTVSATSLPHPPTTHILSDHQIQRKEELARKQAVQDERLNAKAAALRSAKELQRQKVAVIAQANAERVAKALAKAAALPRVTTNTRIPKNENVADSSHICTETEYGNATKSKAKKQCVKCNQIHGSVAEWRKCNLYTKIGDDGFKSVKDGSFFHVI